ncbi:uncharacterized protein [Lepeophtheirus salmonis]|uniref:uncharacterized protein n=1 Tax=Lepeophtheirus salmonis TaxID=72036 RepID=UPI001AE46EA3|nr:uncharacterized protein LOC121120051 [Lepeophtheirus salmonis]
MPPEERLARGYEQCRNLNLTIPLFIEKLLGNQIKDLNNRYHGLTLLIEWSYEFGKANDISMPDSWTTNSAAGFRKPNGLSCRKPEVTLLTRSIPFNRVTVAELFSNLSDVYNRYKFSPQDVYNIDETGFTTIQALSIAVSQVGKKPVWSVTSGERGQLVTVLCSINAGASAIPCSMCFRGQKLAHPSSMEPCPEQRLQLPYLTRCSKDLQVLLTMDNHESHVSLKAITIAEDNDILILPLPPDTSHRLQPLDRTVNEPMKRCYDNASDDWLQSHPARQITIYEIAELTERVHTVDFTPSNAISEFQATGISPLNRNFFPDYAYLPSDDPYCPLCEPIESPEQLKTAVAEETLTVTQQDQSIDNPEQLQAASPTNQPANQ